MFYSSYGIMALLVLLVIDRDVLFHPEEMGTPAKRAYRYFLLSVMAYIATDIAWGGLEQLGLATLLFADTSLYFVAMAASVLLWARYVATSLEGLQALDTALTWAGRLFFVTMVVLVVANLFWPVLFTIDAQGAYHSCFMRNVMLWIQVVLFLLMSLYTLVIARRSEGQDRLKRQAIGLFGLAMGIFVGAQYFYPLLPLYSAGCLLGGCVLHSFVVEGEREEYLRGLEEMVERERKHKQELESATRLANTDPLTGVKSNRAYVEARQRLEQRVCDGALDAFGVVVFDLNGLKLINDSFGHEVGDRYIIDACKLICNCYKHSPVFRIGGDEFAAILEGRDFEARQALLESFDRQIEENLETGQVVVSTGMAIYDADSDVDFKSVFERADKRMYQRKEELKRMGASVRA